MCETETEDTTAGDRNQHPNDPRHILIREWPHPDSSKTQVKSYELQKLISFLNFSRATNDKKTLQK